MTATRPPRSSRCSSTTRELKLAVSLDFLYTYSYTICAVCGAGMLRPHLARRGARNRESPGRSRKEPDSPGTRHSPRASKRGGMNDEEGGHGLAIGELVERTGVGESTLRMWGDAIPFRDLNAF